MTQDTREHWASMIDLPTSTTVLTIALEGFWLTTTIVPTLKSTLLGLGSKILLPDWKVMYEKDFLIRLNALPDWILKLSDFSMFNAYKILKGSMRENFISSRGSLCHWPFQSGILSLVSIATRSVASIAAQEQNSFAFLISKFF